MIVYLITNSVNGKYYVGKTTGSLQDCWKQHVNAALHQSTQTIHCAIRKYGHQVFTVQELACPFPRTQEQLNMLESTLIHQYNSSDLSFGYNQTLGGDGCLQKEETKHKISLANRGQKRSELSRKKFSAAQKLIWTEELRTRHSSIMKQKCSRVGRPHNEESKRKISEARKLFCASKRANAGTGICLQTEEVADAEQNWLLLACNVRTSDNISSVNGLP